MTKDEFMARLRKALSGLPESEISRTLDFYDEMIDDRIEDGMTESAAVEAAGPIETIAAQAGDSACRCRPSGMAAAARHSGYGGAGGICGFVVACARGVVCLPWSRGGGVGLTWLHGAVVCKKQSAISARGARKRSHLRGRGDTHVFRREARHTRHNMAPPPRDTLYKITLCEKE